MSVTQEVIQVAKTPLFASGRLQLLFFVVDSTLLCGRQQLLQALLIRLAVTFSILHFQGSYQENLCCIKSFGSLFCIQV